MSQVAVITGASSGIGESLSYQLSESGYKVVLVARSTDKLNLISDKIRENGRECLAVPIDVSKPDEINKLKEEANAFGDVTVVVNNAGIGKFSRIEDITLEDWNRQMDVNLRASFLMSQVFIPKMKEMKKGSLVFINSVAGKKGYPYSAAYVSSKYGMRGLADSFREELRQDNIKVISIHPGAVNTPFWDNSNSDFSRDEMLKVQTLSESIVHVINASGNFAVEEMVVRRTGGDF
jgi:short-subunit dehydrogenase